MSTTTTQSTYSLLIEFINQRPGLEFVNYGDAKLFRKEGKEISKDKRDFYELLGHAKLMIPDLESKLTAKLTNSSDRLTLKNGALEYCTGQYFPTEYRPAANRVLRDLIWDAYREQHEYGVPLHKDGDAIRKAIRKNFSRRVGLNYFN